MRRGPVSAEKYAARPVFLKVDEQFFSDFLGRNAMFGAAGRKFINFRKYIRYISDSYCKIDIARIFYHPNFSTIPARPGPLGKPKNGGPARPGPARPGPAR
jgi:hypothetical protein